MLRPPKTNDPALNRFLEEVANTIQDRVRPEEGWTLSDFASSVSEVISDKRDLIDIVTQYDNIESLSGEMEAEVTRLKNEIQDSMDLLSSVNSKSAEFAEVMEWWDQNYKVIFDAQEAMEIFGEISTALEGHQDILDQISAATEAAENIVAEIKATEEVVNAAVEAAKTSEINATDAAVRAENSETTAGESAATAAASASAAQASETAAGDSATAAKASETAAATSASTAAADAGRAESAAAGVDQVVTDAAGVLSEEIADGLGAAQSARSGAESARDEAAESATLASTKAGEAAASATLADGRATDAENAVASIATHATDAEDAAGRAAASESNAASSATNAASSATEAQGHADGARVAAIDAADQAVMEKFAEFLEGAPEMLDTWMEVVAAIQSGDSEIAALTAQLATKISGPYTIAVQAGGYPAAGTPSNQITFITEVG